MPTAHEIAAEINKGLKPAFKGFATSAIASTLLGEDAVLIDFYRAPEEASELEKLNSKLMLRLRVHGKGWKKGGPAPANLKVETLRHTPVSRGGVKMRAGKTTPAKVADKVVAWFHKNEYRLKGAVEAKVNPPQKTKMSDSEARKTAKRIRAAGVDGHGGRCGRTAVALNKEFFGGKGSYIASLNEYRLKQGKWTGHVAVKYAGRLWDSGGEIEEEDLLGWGMLDHEDPDWGLPNANAGEDAALFEITEREAKTKFGSSCSVQGARRLFKTTKANPLGTLPAAGKQTWERVYSESLMRNLDEGHAARVAWTVVKKDYEKQGNRWVKKTRRNPKGKTMSKQKKYTKTITLDQHGRSLWTDRNDAWQIAGVKTKKGLIFRALNLSSGKAKDYGTFEEAEDHVSKGARANVRVLHKTKSNPDGGPTKKSGIEIEAVRSKHGPTYQLKIDGKVGRIAIRGYTTSVFVGTDTLTRTLAEQVTHVSRADGSGKSLPFGAKRKVVDAVLARLKGLEALEILTAGANPSLGWKDKEVILDFFEHNKAKSSFLNTDGSNLYLANGDKVASWSGKKVSVKAKGKSGTLVEKALCRMAPASMLSGCSRSSMPNPGGKTWTKSKDPKTGNDVWVYGQDFSTKRHPFAELLLEGFVGRKGTEYRTTVRDALYSGFDDLSWKAAKTGSLSDAKREAERWVAKHAIKPKHKSNIMATYANPTKGDKRYKRGNFTVEAFDGNPRGRDMLPSHTSSRHQATYGSKVDALYAAKRFIETHEPHAVSGKYPGYVMISNHKSDREALWASSADGWVEKWNYLKPKKRTKKKASKPNPSASWSTAVGEDVVVHVDKDGEGWWVMVYDQWNDDAPVYMHKDGYKTKAAAKSAGMKKARSIAKKQAARKRGRALAAVKPNPGRKRKRSHTELEGPFKFPNGRKVYYDAGEGKYYDKSTDLYLGEEEVWDLHTRKGRPKRGAKANPMTAREEKRYRDAIACCSEGWLDRNISEEDDQILLDIIEEHEAKGTKANPKKAKTKATKKKKTAAKKKKASSKKKKGAVKRKKISKK